MPSRWEQIIQTLIAGTDRLPLVMDGATLTPGEVLKALAADQLRRKAGIQFSDAESTPEVFTGTGGKSLPEAARRDLELILSGLHRQALPEFVRLLEAHGAEWPPELLPAALGLCLQGKDAPSCLLPVLDTPGSRARWLAGRQPEWRALFHDEEPDWPVAGFKERIRFFPKLRKESPGKALELLSSTWSGEAAEHRAAFLKCLKVGLDTSDIPFLEQAASDRSREVRWIACRLLSLIPGNRLHHTLEQSAAACLGVWPDIDKENWWKALAPVIDPSNTLVEDALCNRALNWVLTILPESLAAHAAPSLFLEEAADMRQAGALLEGIAWRADRRWQQAVVRFLEQHPDHELRREPALSKVLNSLTDTDWNQAIAQFMHHPPLWNNPQNIIPGMLLQEQRPWGRDLVAGLLHQIASKTQQPFAFPAPPLPQLLGRAAYQCDVTEAREIANSLPELSQAGGSWKQELERFHSILRFRAAMQFHFR